MKNKSSRCRSRTIWKTDAVPRLTVNCKNHYLTIGKETIRYIGAPAFFTLLLNREEGRLLVTPCDEKDYLAFTVPKGIWENGHCNLRIYSKAFVTDLINTFGFASDLSLHLIGTYDSAINAVIFSLTEH